MIHAQVQSPRQAGTADLNARSRQAIGEADQFTNPDAKDWIPYIPHKDDVIAGGILDAGASPYWSLVKLRP